jgi:hypothetical protein
VADTRSEVGHILVSLVDALAAFKPEREGDGVLKVFEIGRIFADLNPRCTDTPGQLDQRLADLSKILNNPILHEEH